MMKKYALTDNNVVVVIGSGAGGGVLANELAQKGIDVVCLEAGKRLQQSDIVNDNAEMFGKMTWLDRRIGIGNTVPGFPVWTCKTVGGTTMHWTAVSLRLQEHEFRSRETYGEIENTSLVDWPIKLNDLEPWYAKAEDRMGVTGTHGIPRLPGHNNFKVLEAGGRKMGYRHIDTNNVAINSQPRDGRPGCLQLGFCTSGCAIHAKWSTLYTEIPKAEKTGHFELRTECMTVKIVHDKDGKVREVHYLDADGKLNIQKARVVCVAGNAVETTRLLLNSKSERFADGLANSSDQLGRNYMRHNIDVAIGEMPGEVNMHRGAHLAGIIRDERVHEPSRGFSGGFMMYTVPFSPDVLASLLKPGGWGRDLTAILENYDHLAGMMLMGEDLPEEGNRISLHERETDNYGLPVPVIRYESHPNSVNMQEYAMGKAESLYRSLGAKKVHRMMNVLPAGHNMGTARIGKDPRQSVCNPWGQTHDIANLFVSDGSLFPTSGCENPTLTIVALVLRQAKYLAEQLNSGHI